MITGEYQMELFNVPDLIKEHQIRDQQVKEGDRRILPPIIKITTARPINKVTLI
jgi:hypothetical protein